MGISKDFEKLILNLYNQNKKEIFSFQYNEKKYWLKKARATKSQFLHKLFYNIFPISVLLPVKEKNLTESISFETNKIEDFNQLNINTPKIVFKNNDLFVLEDCGRTINSFIRKKDVKKEKVYYYIDKVLYELSKIHNLNKYHGGAQARNFTYKDGKIYVIDFEDNFDNDIDIKTLQIRDLILFLLSLTKIKANFQIDNEYVINKYIELCPSNSLFHYKLKELANKISFFIMLSQIRFINNLMGKDGRGFFKLFLVLKNLKG